MAERRRLASNPSTSIKATLVPRWIGGVRYGYLHDVEMDGETIVNRSRTPEHDFARVLLARGVTGKVQLVDPDGSPRMVVDVERMAPWTVVEDDRRGLRLVRWKPFSLGASSEEASP